MQRSPPLRSELVSYFLEQFDPRSITQKRWTVFLLLLALSPATLGADTYFSDFNSGPPAGMTLFGQATVSGGFLQLTPAANAQFGVAYIDDFGGGQLVQSFHATFKVALFGATCCGGGALPGDGFSFNLVPAATVLPNPVYGEPAEEGLREGLAVTFDTWDNGGGEGPAIDVKWMGAIIASAPFQASQSPAGAVDPVTASREVIIDLKPDGTIDVSYGGTLLLSNVPTTYCPGAIGVPKWVLGARTGGANDNHWIDDLALVALTASTVPRNALSFDGVDDYVYAPAGIWFTGDFTVEGWVFARSYNNWSRLLDFGNADPDTGDGTDNVVVALTEGTSGRPHFNVVRIFDTSHGISAPNAMPLNQWTHLACVLSNNTGTIYINGVAVVSGLLNQPRAVSRAGCYLARSNWARDGYANAIFDEVRIWNVARTPAQIQEAMRRQLSGSESGLSAYYRFDEGCGLNAFDATRNPSNGATLVNGPAWLASTILPFAPTVTTLTASMVTSTSATLIGSANPNGAAATAWFQWGATAAYGNLTPSQSLGNGAPTVSWIGQLSGLTPGTTYHYRAMATNIHGASFSTDQTFRSTQALSITRLGNQVVLSWPSSELIFRLQSADTLPAGNTWANVSGNPVLSGGIYRIMKNITEASKFYRLINP